MMRSAHSTHNSSLALGHSPTVMSVVKAILFALPRSHENHIDKYQENKQQIKLLKVYFCCFCCIRVIMMIINIIIIIVILILTLSHKNRDTFNTLWRFIVSTVVEKERGREQVVVAIRKSPVSSVFIMLCSLLVMQILFSSFMFD